MHRCPVMRLGRMEVTFRNGKVVTAHADGILGDSASELMQFNPAQGSVAIAEDSGRKPRRLAVEDPNLWQVDLDFGLVVMHASNLCRHSCQSPGRPLPTTR